MPVPWVDERQWYRYNCRLPHPQSHTLAHHHSHPPFPPTIFSSCSPPPFPSPVSSPFPFSSVLFPPVSPLHLLLSPLANNFFPGHPHSLPHSHPLTVYSLHHPPTVHPLHHPPPTVHSLHHPSPTVHSLHYPSPILHFLHHPPSTVHSLHHRALTVHSLHHPALTYTPSIIVLWLYSHSITLLHHHPPPTANSLDRALQTFPYLSLAVLWKTEGLFFVFPSGPRVSADWRSSYVIISWSHHLHHSACRMHSSNSYYPTVLSSRQVFGVLHCRHQNMSLWNQPGLL